MKERKGKIVVALILVIFLCTIVFMYIDKNNNYRNITTVQNYEDIGNLGQEYPAALCGNYIYYCRKGGIVYKYNVENGKVTFGCKDPTCPHESDCPSINKYSLQSYGARLFAKGNFETDVSTVVYSSFGEIEDGSYKKIIEKDSMITYPSIVNNKILAEINNSIVLIDINSGKTLKKYDFDQALSLHQLLMYEDDIYFINGLNILNKIDIKTGKTTRVSDKKVKKIIIVKDTIYFIATEKNQLSSMDIDGKNIKQINSGVRTFNILDDNVYYSKYSVNGVFCLNLKDSTEKKLSDFEEIDSICIFADNNKLLMSSYEHNYISNTDGTQSEELINPEAIVLEY